MDSINGKNSVTTGGETGFSLEAAKRLLQERDFVFIFGRRHDIRDDAAAEIGLNARAVKGSVAHAELSHSEQPI